MRPGQQNKRGRGRNNNNSSSNNGGGGGGGNNNHNRKGQNPLTRTYDSSGPDVKIRGTAQHIAEKYGNLARDAQSSGDRVIAENYLQHAEHYNRIIAAAQAQMQERYQRDERSFDERDGSDRDQNDQDDMDQGYAEEAPAVVQHVQSQPVQAQPIQSERAQSERAQPQPVQARRPPRPQPQPQQQPQPVMDGSGPQPVIEGVPAEVSLEEEEGAAPAGRAPSRRRGTPRPRRQPRRGDATAEEGAPAPTGGEAPALVEVSE
ncbi:DUF4167 domain-containing protein [Pararhizobium capsulatum]|uniref:DUF4167 domain-containing protein n=1 Tax=Pararhizobium capsulatum TaxID=34014 RepID=UPI0027D90E91|nr:DUF4167 domain-containing protein [Pararhizobium capsulatum]